MLPPRCTAEPTSGTELTREGPLNLKFKDVDFGKFTDPRTLGIDRTALIKTVADHSQLPVHREQVEAALDNLCQEAQEFDVDPWDVCNGHDLVALLEIGLCRLFGSCQRQELKRLDRILMLTAYHRQDFEQTSLYAAMRAWEQAHPGYPLLTRHGAGGRK